MTRKQVFGLARRQAKETNKAQYVVYDNMRDDYGRKFGWCVYNGWNEDTQYNMEIGYLKLVAVICPDCLGSCEVDHNSYQCHKCQKLYPLSYN